MSAENIAGGEGVSVSIIPGPPQGVIINLFGATANQIALVPPVNSWTTVQDALQAIHSGGITVTADQVNLNPSIGSWTTIQDALQSLSTTVQGPAGSTGSVQFNNAGNFAAGNLTWDNANGRLGIGNSSPAYSLDVQGDINLTGQLRINGIPINIKVV